MRLSWELQGFNGIYRDYNVTMMGNIEIYPLVLKHGNGKSISARILQLLQGFPIATFDCRRVRYVLRNFSLFFCLSHNTDSSWTISY